MTSVAAGAASRRSLIRQSAFRETLGDVFDVLLPKGLPAEMRSERVFRIDLHEFAADATGLFDVAEMTKRGSEHGAREIRSPHKANPLPEQDGCCFIFAGEQIRRTEEVEILLTPRWVETHGALDCGNCF
jgi:hypothetical protein